MNPSRASRSRPVLDASLDRGLAAPDYEGRRLVPCYFSRVAASPLPGSWVRSPSLRSFAAVMRDGTDSSASACRQGRCGRCGAERVPDRDGSSGGIEHRVSVGEGSGSPDHSTGYLPRRPRLAGRWEPQPKAPNSSATLPSDAATGADGNGCRLLPDRAGGCG